MGHECASRPSKLAFQCPASFTQHVTNANCSLQLFITSCIHCCDLSQSLFSAVRPECPAVVPLRVLLPIVSSANWVWLVGATVTGSTITVEGCGSESLQGDVRFAEVMGLMGAKVQWQPYSITITGAYSRYCL